MSGENEGMEINKACWAFNERDDVIEVGKQLKDGLNIVRVWEEFKRLPQYRHLPLE